MFLAAVAGFWDIFGVIGLKVIEKDVCKWFQELPYKPRYILEHVNEPHYSV